MSLAGYFGDSRERIRLDRRWFEELGVRVTGPVLAGQASVGEQQMLVAQTADLRMMEQVLERGRRSPVR